MASTEGMTIQPNAPKGLKVRGALKGMMECC